MEGCAGGEEVGEWELCCEVMGTYRGDGKGVLVEDRSVVDTLTI